MRPLRLVAFALALTILAAVPARADGYISPFVGFNFGGDSANCAHLTSCNEKRTNFGVAIGSSSGIIGVEEELAYAKDFFGSAPGASNSVLTLMSNLVLVIPAGPVQPYGIVGLGLIRAHAALDSSALSLTKNTLGYDIGAGLNIYLVHSVGIRGDVRHMHTLQDVTLGVFSSAKLDFWRGSAGVTFRF
jgi:opacity protein-like surface antigen